MASDKRDVIKEFQDFCYRGRYVEDMTTASYFCELYLNKETKINGQRITRIYEYINRTDSARKSGLING